MSDGLRFLVTAVDAGARLGKLYTAHGEIDTPVFMPVGTAGTVKGLTPEQIHATGASTILCNTYHLMLRPSGETISHLGGLHQFMNWSRPILTDSGGFQIMSLAQLRKVGEQGVTFKSHIDGSKNVLTPERCMHLQKQFNSNIAMVLDHCISFPANYAQAEDSMFRSMRWAERCRIVWEPRPGYGLFGIVQGGLFDSLRRTSVEALIDLDFDGYAIGGLAVGEGYAEMMRIAGKTANSLPKDRPRYLMGVGKPDDIVNAVLRGVDMFDCVLPTRSGRTGQAFTTTGPINIRNARFANDPAPLDPKVPCPASCNYSRGYLHHLVKAKEILGAVLLSWHNIAFYQWLMSNLRDAIAEGRIEEFASEFVSAYRQV